MKQNLISPSPELRAFLLRAATAAGHQGESNKELLAQLEASIENILPKRERPSDTTAKFAFGIMKKIARTAAEVEKTTSLFISAEAIAEGGSGFFDSRSLSCWLALAEKAGVDAVPAKPILKLPEFALSLMISPDIIDVEPEKPSIFMRAADMVSGGALSRALGPVDRMPIEDKRKIYGLTIALCEKAGQEIPGGHMVRHDHMGPGTLKAWAGIGWEPMNGDDGVSFREGDRCVTLGPGWVSVGNKRYLDVTDARTIKAISLAFTPEHTFHARPWVTPARRYTGLDVHRPADWPEEDRRGSWPAEWRVFIRGGKAVAVASYYCWADIPGDETDRAAAEEALRLGQKIADTATEAGCIPEFLDFIPMRRRFAEIRENLPEGTINATLDFIETDDGLMLIEGGPAYAPGGRGAHPCAALGQRWPEGIFYRLADGVDIIDPSTWGDMSLHS